MPMNTRPVLSLPLLDGVSLFSAEDGKSPHRRREAPSCPRLARAVQPVVVVWIR